MISFGPFSVVCLFVLGLFSLLPQERKAKEDHDVYSHCFNLLLPPPSTNAELHDSLQQNLTIERWGSQKFYETGTG